MCDYFLNKLKYFKRIDYSLMLYHLSQKYQLPFNQVEKEIIDFIIFHTDEIGIAKSVFYLKNSL